MRLALLKMLAGALAVMALANPAASQTNAYPNKPVRVLAPGPGGLDGIVRRFMPVMAQGLGQPIVVENRPVGPVLGQAAVRAQPDGYTLLFAAGPHWLAPLTDLNVPYDPVKDFAAISMIYIQPNVLLVNNALKVNSVKELIAMAKQKPGQINLGAGPPGTSGTLAGTLFREMADVDMYEIRYKAGAERSTALLSNEISVDILGGASARPLLASGKIKALAVTSKRASAQFPGVPPLADTVPDFEYGSTTILFAPAKTPAPIVTRLNQEANRALKAPEIVKMLADNSAEPLGDSPQVASDYVKWDLERMGKLLRAAGITPQ